MLEFQMIIDLTTYLEKAQQVHSEQVELFLNTPNYIWLNVKILLYY